VQPGKRMKKKKLIAIFILLALPFVIFLRKTEENPVLNVGYFHGGRTMLLYRALVNDYFEREKLTAYFFTKELRSSKWEKYDRNGDETTFLGRRAGKATGLELVDLLMSKKVDMSFIGEAAFMKSCAEDVPIVAIAQLGSDEESKGGHSIVIKKGIKINGPKDLEKIVWGTRRSSGGDDIFLKEFLYQEGVDLSKVKIISGIDDDKITKAIVSGKIQGAYHHLMMVRNDEINGYLYTYRKLDWVNPNISQAIAVVRRDYFEKNREIIKRFVRGYMKRIAFEHNLPDEVRKKNAKMPDQKTYQISLYELEMDYKGMNLPQYPLIPIMRKDLTQQAMEMFARHKFIEHTFPVDKCYDNSIVLEVAKELYPQLNLKL